MADDPFEALNESARGKILKDCLARWSTLAGEGSLTDLVEAIYHDLSIPALIARLDEPQEADERIKSFLDMVAMLSETGMDLNGFISFLDKLKDAGLVIPVEGAGRDNAQAVRLMSIHKSKGLEFPVIYLADLKHRFNEDDARSTILFAKDYGFALPADTPYGLTPSFKKRLITASLHDEDLSEEIRKLYVALTRAEEKIIILSPNFDPEKSVPAGTAPDFVEVLRAHSFLDFFTLISASLADSIRPLDVSDLAIGAPQVEAQKRTSVPFVLHPELPTHEEIEEKVLAPVIPTPGRLRALAIGTRLHREVERLDFTRPLAMQIAKLSLPKSDFKRLMAFAALPLFKYTAQAIYQEHAYDLNGDRGKLDLLIDEVDRYIVIDFKLADLDKVSYEEQLARYRAYVETLGAKPVETYLYSFSTGELRKIG